MGMKISATVIIYQLVLIAIQYFAFHIKGKKGLIIAYVLILLWSLIKTFSTLFLLQVIIQTLCFLYFFSKTSSGKPTREHKQ